MEEYLKCEIKKRIIQIINSYCGGIKILELWCELTKKYQSITINEILELVAEISNLNVLVYKMNEKKSVISYFVYIKRG